MQISFFGAAQTVTGSKHLVSTNWGTNILLDCGMFQGGDSENQSRNRHFGFDPASIQYLILSHAHIDHSGLIPAFVKQGFRGKIYTTHATKDLCELMLADSAHIQVNELKYLNRRREKRGEEKLKPIYDEGDVIEALTHFHPVKYNTWVEIEEGVRFLLSDAGHVLGSAAINLEITEGEETHKILFTGDIGRPHDRILRSPIKPDQADIIICESTYGDRLHENEGNTKEKLLKIVNETCVLQRGKLLIPAFSVDRTQELIYMLDQLSSEGKLPSIPVYVDSPMSVKATKIMKDHDECFNPEILEYIEKDGDAFCFPNLHYISELEQSKALNFSSEPAIIISASGMAEAGRIKHHIRNNIEKANTTILFVGYATPSSLGGILRNNPRSVKIFGDILKVNARIEIMDSFSGHGDYEEMLDFLSSQNSGLVKKLFLVHGDLDAQTYFKDYLEEKGYKNIEIPEFGDIFEF